MATFLIARWNGRCSAAGASRSTNVALEEVDGDAAGPELEAAVGLAALGQLGGQVGILDHLRAAVDSDHHAQLLVGADLLDHLERHLGVGLAVQAEERRVGDLDERVVDLEIEERADAPLPHLVEAARAAVGPGRGQGRQGAAVAVGAEGDAALLGQQDLAGLAVDGRHLPLDEEADVVEAEVVVLGEERGRSPRGSRGWS